MVGSKIYSLGVIKNRLAPLFQDPRLQLVLLFGSFASGQVHPGSDIDIGVILDGPVDILDLTNRVINLLHTDRVDVVDLRRASPLLSFSAVRYGKVLYERSPGQFNMFASLSFRRYVDTQKLRDARQRFIRDFLKEKGLS